MLKLETNELKFIVFGKTKYLKISTFLKTFIFIIILLHAAIFLFIKGDSEDDFELYESKEISNEIEINNDNQITKANSTIDSQNDKSQTFELSGNNNTNNSADNTEVKEQTKQNAQTEAIITDQSSNLINLNTASLSELQNIPGVGPSTAQKIIDYRNEKGGFNKISDIKKVKGIGTKKFEKMKDSICV